jgi:hypothetical protein
MDRIAGKFRLILVLALVSVFFVTWWLNSESGPGCYNLCNLIQPTEGHPGGPERGLSQPAAAPSCKGSRSGIGGILSPGYFNLLQPIKDPLGLECESVFHLCVSVAPISPVKLSQG